MITDLHIHTEFSCDCEADMEQYVKQASIWTAKQANGLYDMDDFCGESI